MYGKLPLINYYSIQKMVRDYETLEVILTEIPKNGTKYPNFPLIYNIPIDKNKPIDIERIQ